MKQRCISSSQFTPLTSNFLSPPHPQPLFPTKSGEKSARVPVARDRAKVTQFIGSRNRAPGQPQPLAMIVILLLLSPAANAQEGQQTNSGGPVATRPDSDDATPTGALPLGYRRTGEDKAADVRLLCEATAETGLFSGAVLVADRGQVIFQAGFGKANREWGIPNDKDTKFRLASISKQFCSMVVMQLVQEGKVRLEDTISDHLFYYRKDTGDRISLHHLLCHQSGIRDFTANFDYRATISRTSYSKDDFIKQHCSNDLLHDPGTLYSYCNAGYCILGRIIEKATGKSYEQNLRDRIFGPLGMTNSGIDRNRYLIEKRASGYTRGSFGLENADYIEMDSTPGAAGAIYSTVGDMFLWDRALYTDKLLGEQYRQRMFTPNRDVAEVKAAGGRAHSVYGYGWRIYTHTHPVTKNRTKVIHHGGAINGFRGTEYRLVDDDAFVIVLCNQGDPLGGADVWNAVVRLGTELVHIVTGQPYRMPAKARVTQDQRLYRLAKTEGVDAAMEWFKAKGKKAAWGGSLLAPADQLIKEGRIDDGLRLMELDVELTPEKVWLLRKTSQAFLDHGQPEEALIYAKRGLQQKPLDEKLLGLKAEAEHVLGSKRTASVSTQGAEESPSGVVRPKP